MTMFVTVSTGKRIDAAQLYGELVAAGIRMEPMVPGVPLFMRDSNRFTVVVPDGTDEGTVRQVVAAHAPAPEPTAAQIKRRQARKLIESSDTPIVRLLVNALREMHEEIVETRTWCNQLRQRLQDAGMPVPPRLQNQSAAEKLEAIISRTESEIPDEETNEMEVPK